MDQARIDLMNAALRPTSIGLLVAVGALFLVALGTIMLVRYAIHGEIDWAGITAFMVGVVGPVVQHFQNRHDLKIRELGARVGGVYVNPEALA